MLVTAISWVQDVLLGTVATSVAVIAVAAIGFGMLTGRINIRHGVTVVMGCFILFGASSIVAGLRYAASSAGGYDALPPVIVQLTSALPLCWLTESVHESFGFSADVWLSLPAANAGSGAAIQRDKPAASKGIEYFMMLPLGWSPASRTVLHTAPGIKFGNHALFAEDCSRIGKI